MACMHVRMGSSWGLQKHPGACRTRTHVHAACMHMPQGVDELGNFITYTAKSCIPALGHFTEGQVVAMHRAMAYSNPRMYK